MNCFRYVDHTEKNCVEMRLFRGENGIPRADVIMAGSVDNAPSSVVELARCVTLDNAFETAIRMANRNDTELVVSGNSELWQRQWGTLDVSTPTAQRDQTIG